jgi:hypothetical protein
MSDWCAPVGMTLWTEPLARWVSSGIALEEL